MMNVFDPPMDESDYERANELAFFLGDRKWTLGQAKRAFAYWYERAGMPSGHGEYMLRSDLQDFVGAVVKLRAQTLQELQATLKPGTQFKCDFCLEKDTETILTATQELVDGTGSVQCHVCGRTYIKDVKST